jgi:hypothetical protein
MARREAPAVSGNGYGAIGIALLGAPFPSFEGSSLICPRASPRRGDDAWPAEQQTPALPLWESTTAIFNALPLRCLSANGAR